MNPDKLEIKYIKWDESRYIVAIITLDDILMQLYRIALNTTSDYMYERYDENTSVNIDNIEKATKRAIHVQEGYVVGDIHKDNLKEIKEALLNKEYLICNDAKLIITKKGLACFVNIRDALLTKAVNDAKKLLNDWVSQISSTEKKINIFLSYCRSDNKLADEIESLFSKNQISIIRDKKDIEAWKSIREFMDSIQITDYVIMIISDSYLKSYNCMYETRQVLNNKEYRNRIFPFVTSSAESIYKFEGKMEYIKYWEQEYDETKKSISEIDNIENIQEIVEHLRIIKEISHSVSEFLHTVSDMYNPFLEEIKIISYR